MKKNALLTGGCGFIGSNLAARLVQEGWHVTIFDNLSRQGPTENLAWLATQGHFDFAHGDTATFVTSATLIA
jgi:CDP-paratose 2-epimerase